MVFPERSGPLVLTLYRLIKRSLEKVICNCRNQPPVMSCLHLQWYFFLNEIYITIKTE